MARPAYQASPICGHWGRERQLRPRASPALNSIASDVVEEPALLPVYLLWAPGKASLSLGVLTCPVWPATPPFRVTRVAMGSCQASGDAPGTARSWQTAGAASPASLWGPREQTLRQGGEVSSGGKMRWGRGGSLRRVCDQPVKGHRCWGMYIPSPLGHCLRGALGSSLGRAGASSHRNFSSKNSKCPMRLFPWPTLVGILSL